MLLISCFLGQDVLESVLSLILPEPVSLKRFFN